jgi:hypothetical protein
MTVYLKKGVFMKVTILLFITVAFLFVSSVAWAHPAKRIDLTFDKKTKILTANVVHDVKDKQRWFK